MGSVLKSITFDHALFETELAAFGDLLASKVNLSETDDIQPLFRASKHLSAFLGTFAPDIGPATELAYEFPFFGDYQADLLVGSKSAAHFCVVEFEEGRPDSIFKKQPKRSNPEWSARFEHGFSQLTDWFFNLDDYKKSHGFTKTFGYGHVSFTGLLVIGRSAGLDDMNAVICVTFDDVHEIFRKRYALYKAAASLENSLADRPNAPPNEEAGGIEPA